MAMLDLSCLESGLSRHGPARQLAEPERHLGPQAAQFPLPEVDDVSAMRDLHAR